MAAFLTDEVAMVKPMREDLKLSTLAELDPRIEVLFQKHVQACANDCRNRPGDKTPRKLTIEFQIEPVMDESGECEEVTVTLQAKSKVPDYKTKSFPMSVSRSGLAFNPATPTELDQTVLFDRDDE